MDHQRATTHEIEPLPVLLLVRRQARHVRRHPRRPRIRQDRGTLLGPGQGVAPVHRGQTAPDFKVVLGIGQVSVLDPLGVP